MPMYYGLMIFPPVRLADKREISRGTETGMKGLFQTLRLSGILSNKQLVNAPDKLSCFIKTHHYIYIRAESKVPPSLKS